MNGGMIEAARAEVRNKYGEALEKKASDQMVIQLAGMMLPGAEAVASSQGAILEFKAEKLGDEARAAQARLESMPSFREFQESLGDESPEVKRQSRPHHLVRPQVVRDAKARFRQATSGVRETLEKAQADAAGPAGPEALPAEPAVRVCWLNSTMRAADATPALAEVAADENLRRLDVPRRLILEIDETTGIVGAPAFRRDSGLSGTGVVVAVIDTEVAVNHAAFDGRAELKANHSREAFGNPQRHGTAVAGIIGSENATFTGVAPGATIFAYKIFPSATDFEGALAIQSALEDGAQIANCSWGSGLATDGTSREAVACDNAWALGMIVVKSAGNRGPRSGSLSGPADAEGIIVVGATNRAGTRMEDYSSRGPTGDGRNRPHLVAPGGDLGIRGISSALPSGGFGDVGSGTSFAAPHVAGLAALVLEQSPELTPDEVRDALIAKCRQLDEGAVDDQGAGLVVF